MSQKAFHGKWGAIKGTAVQADEKSLYVEPGNTPITQRQLNLWYYFVFIRKYLEELGVKNVMEIGCGRGTTALYLAEYLKLKLTCLDNEADAVALAREGFAQRGLAAEFVVGDATQTSLPAASFDAIVSIGLAEHLEETDMLFAEQYRLLKPGGIMISLNIPKKFSVQYMNTVYRFFLRIAGKYTDSVRKDYYRNAFSGAEYAASAQRAGFATTEVTYVCPFPIYVPLSIASDKRITRVRKAVLAIRRLFQPYPFKTNRLFAQAHFLVAKKA